MYILHRNLQLLLEHIYGPKGHLLLTFTNSATSSQFKVFTPCGLFVQIPRLCQTTAVSQNLSGLPWDKQELLTLLHASSSPWQTGSIPLGPSAWSPPSALSSLWLRGQTVSISARGWWSYNGKPGQGPICSGASRTYLELLLYSDSCPLPGSGPRVGCVYRNSSISTATPFSNSSFMYCLLCLWPVRKGTRSPRSTQRGIWVGGLMVMGGGKGLGGEIKGQLVQLRQVEFEVS